MRAAPEAPTAAALSRALHGYRDQSRWLRTTLGRLQQELEAAQRECAIAMLGGEAWPPLRCRHLDGLQDRFDRFASELAHVRLGLWSTTQDLARLHALGEPATIVAIGA